MKTKIAMFNLNRKSTFRTTLLALMLPLILGGAGFLGSPAWAAEPQYGGSITFLDGYGGRFPPIQWDPSKGVWTVGVYVEPYYETLLATDFVKYGPRGTNEYPSYHSQGAIEELLTGRLAESWSVPDETTLIFKLRQGIMWQAKPGVMESRELTAEDVVYSFKRNLADAFTWGAHAKIESITAKDKYTVEFKLESWIADWYLWFGYASWGAAAIYPEEVVDAGIGEWRNHTGTGILAHYQFDGFIAEFVSILGSNQGQERGRATLYGIEIHGTTGTLFLPGATWDGPDIYYHPHSHPTLPGDDLWEVLVDNTLSAREKWLNAHHRSARAMIDMIDGKPPEYELCLGPAARIGTEMAVATRVSHIKGARGPFPLEEKGDPFETWK